MNQDLFPESLLVSVVGGRPYTTSLLVAKHFHKLHKNVLRGIESLACSEGFRRLNFEPTMRPVQGPKGAVRMTPEYRLTRDGFFRLVMALTGEKAGLLMEDFLAAFNAMEAELQARTARYAAALDQVRPSLRPVVEGTEQGLRRVAIAQPLGKTANSVTYHRGQARRLGLLAAAQVAA